jgi:hypothetical protein
MADANGYGYNSKGVWTLLQPGEAEWDPSKALETIYGNDNTSLLGQYYQAGGNMSTAGGLMMNSSYNTPGTSIAQNVYDYTRPWTDQEMVGIRNANNEWTNMYLGSEIWNPNGSNSYEIQNAPIDYSRNNVVDRNRWTNWATTNKFIQPAANNTGNNNTGSNTGAPETRGGLPQTNQPGVTNGAPTPGTPAPTLATTGQRPSFKRSSSGSAFSGEAQYNQFQNQPISDGGVVPNYGGLGYASQQGNRNKGNWNSAIWS